MAERSEYLYKILIVGDVNVGKTSLVRRYTKDIYNKNTKPTLGVDFSLKELTSVAPNTLIRAQVWDVAGQDRHKNITRVYYKDAVAAIIVFDVTDQKSLDGAVDWKKDINDKVFDAQGEPIPCLLLANKSDLGGHCVSRADLLEFSKQHRFLNFFFTSARSGDNVDSSFDWLITRVYDTAKMAPKPVAPANGAPKTIELKQNVNSTSLKRLKVLCIGTKGSGSTSVVHKFVKDAFSTTVPPTTTATTMVKTIQLTNEQVNLCLVDAPPNAKPTPALMDDVCGALFVYDSTRSESLKEIKDLKAAFNVKYSGIPSAVLSNKTDLSESNVLSRDEMESIKASHKFNFFFDTSAKSNQNIDECITTLCNHIVKTNPAAGRSSASRPQKKKSCC
ncbi:Ras-related protein Rab-32B [Diplonema papillatum]|nr:Ras-related protein Rab-32B [Diplonema papillatum]